MGTPGSASQTAHFGKWPRPPPEVDAPGSETGCATFRSGHAHLHRSAQPLQERAEPPHAVTEATGEVGSVTSGSGRLHVRKWNRPDLRDPAANTSTLREAFGQTRQRRDCARSGCWRERQASSALPGLAPLLRVVSQRSSAELLSGSSAIFTRGLFSVSSAIFARPREMRSFAVIQNGTTTSKTGSGTVWA